MKCHRAWLLTALLVCVLAAPAWATTWHVAKTGSDSVSCATAQTWSTGSPGNAKLTINSALGCLTNGVGGTLVLHAGTFAESINNSTLSGAAGAPILLTVNGTDSVTIAGSGTSTIINLSGVSYWQFDGGSTLLHINGAYGIEHGFFLSNGSDPKFPGDCHHTLNKVEVTGIGRSNDSNNGEPVYASCNYFTLTASHIHDNHIGYEGGTASTPNCNSGNALNFACSGIHGLYVSGHHAIIDGNEVDHNPDFGIQLYNGFGGNPGGNTAIHDSVVRNNNVHHNATDCKWGRGGITVNTGANNQIYNNVVWNNGTASCAGSALSFDFNAVSYQVYNNTVYNNKGFAVELAAFGGTPTSTGIDIENNIFDANNFGGALDYVSQNGVGMTTKTNMCPVSQTGCTLISSNFAFTNAGAGDFTLQSSSSAIDAGTTLQPVATDISGGLRPVNGLYDIGAYEFGSTTGGGGGSCPVVANNTFRVTLADTANLSCPGGYTLFRQVGGIGAFTALTGARGIALGNVADGPLVTGQRYDYQFACTNNAGLGPVSDPACAVAILSPVAPINVQAQGSNSLLWDDPSNSNIVEYHVYRKVSTQPDSTYAQVATVDPTARQVTVTGLTVGVTYSFYLKAFGTSPPSGLVESSPSTVVQLTGAVLPVKPSSAPLIAVGP